MTSKSCIFPFLYFFIFFGSTRAGKLHIDFMFFERSMLTEKSKDDHLRRWTLKRFFSDFGGQSLICELILTLVLLGYFSTHLKKTFKVNDRLKLTFLMINRGYNINDRLNFILKVIKRYYNANDQLKFIWTFIKWDYGLNDWLKLA